MGPTKYPHCRQEVLASVTACPYCPRDILRNEQADAQRKNRRGIAAGAVLVCGIIFAGCVATGHKDATPKAKVQTNPLPKDAKTDGKLSTLSFEEIGKSIEELSNSGLVKRIDSQTREAFVDTNIWSMLAYD